MSHKLSFVLYSTKIILIFRLILIIIGLIFVVLFPLYGLLSFLKFNGKNRMKWLPTDGVSIYILIYIYNYYFILVYFLYILFKK
jgi:hypothetical protein